MMKLMLLLTFFAATAMASNLDFAITGGTNPQDLTKMYKLSVVERTTGALVFGTDGQATNGLQIAGYPTIAAATQAFMAVIDLAAGSKNWNPNAAGGEAIELVQFGKDCIPLPNCYRALGALDCKPLSTPSASSACASARTSLVAATQASPKISINTIDDVKAYRPGWTVNGNDFTFSWNGDVLVTQCSGAAMPATTAVGTLLKEAANPDKLLVKTQTTGGGSIIFPVRVLSMRIVDANGACLASVSRVAMQKYSAAWRQILSTYAAKAYAASAPVLANFVVTTDNNNDDAKLAACLADVRARQAKGENIAASICYPSSATMAQALVVAEEKTHMCECPPALAQWPCTESDFNAVHDGTQCAFYQTTTMVQAIANDDTAKLAACLADVRARQAKGENIATSICYPSSATMAQALVVAEEKTHMCDCPPAQARWECTESDFNAVRATCPFYQTPMAMAQAQAVCAKAGEACGLTTANCCGDNVCYEETACISAAAFTLLTVQKSTPAGAGAGAEGKDGIVRYTVSLPAELSVVPYSGKRWQTYGATYTTTQSGSRQLLHVSLSDYDGDAYVNLVAGFGGNAPSCTLDFGANLQTKAPLVTTLERNGLNCQVERATGTGLHQTIVVKVVGAVVVAQQAQQRLRGGAAVRMA